VRGSPAPSRWACLQTRWYPIAASYRAEPLPGFPRSPAIGRRGTKIPYLSPITSSLPRVPNEWPSRWFRRLGNFLRWRKFLIRALLFQAEGAPTHVHVANPCAASALSAPLCPSLDRIAGQRGCPCPCCPDRTFGGRESTYRGGPPPGSACIACSTPSGSPAPSISTRHPSPAPAARPRNRASSRCRPPSGLPCC
jgi:hypothetical protein